MEVAELMAVEVKDAEVQAAQEVTQVMAVPVEPITPTGVLVQVEEVRAVQEHTVKQVEVLV